MRKWGRESYDRKYYKGLPVTLVYFLIHKYFIGDEWIILWRESRIMESFMLLEELFWYVSTILNKYILARLKNNPLFYSDSVLHESQS